MLAGKVGAAGAIATMTRWRRLRGFRGHPEVARGLHGRIREAIGLLDDAVRVEPAAAARRSSSFS